MDDHGDLSRCIHCGAWINTEYGIDAPGTNQGHAGTKDDPRAPGDFDNICDDCQYGKGLRGYPKPSGALGSKHNVR